MTSKDDLITSKDDLIQLIKERARHEPVRLSSGGTTDVYLDLKHVLDTGGSINLAMDALSEVFFEAGLEFDAIGGPTMGADVVSLGWVSNFTTDIKWFSVREPKTGHGLGKTIEGAELGPGDLVLLTDDVVNTGQSLLWAYDMVVATGAQVVAVVPLVDRSETAGVCFGQRGVTYLPVLTYKDLDLPPIGS